MSTSLRCIPLRFPDTIVSIPTSIVPFVYLTLSNNYTVIDTQNSTNYIGKNTDTWKVVNDTTNAFDSVNAEFLCQYTGTYTVTPTLRDGKTCLFTINLEIYPPDTSGYSVRIESGEGLFTRKTSFTTNILQKGTKLKIRIHIESTSSVNSFIMAGITGEDPRTNGLPSENSVITFQYNPDIIMASQTTIPDIRHI